LLARTNGWDVADLATLRAHPMLANLKGAADNLFSKDQLAEVSDFHDPAVPWNTPGRFAKLPADLEPVAACL
jgi:hypothetical protein